jgi:hypothetical protein
MITVHRMQELLIKAEQEHKEYEDREKANPEAFLTRFTWPEFYAHVIVRELNRPEGHGHVDGPVNVEGPADGWFLQEKDLRITDDGEVV